MKVNIPKKIFTAVIFCLLGHIINTFLETLLGYNGTGYTILSIIVVGAVLCASSRHIRVGKLKSEHKGDDSTEKTVFNSDLKSKVKFILGSKNFKIEIAIYLFISLILVLIPYFQLSFAYGFDVVFSNSSNILYLIGWMILMPLYMAVLDIISWISAYNRCYKRREY